MSGSFAKAIVDQVKTLPLNREPEDNFLKVSPTVLAEIIDNHLRALLTPIRVDAENIAQAIETVLPTSLK